MSSRRKKQSDDPKLRDYVILARFAVDDVPVRIVKDSTVDDAIERAKDLSWGDIVAAVGVMDAEPGELICLAVVEIGLAGAPVAVTLVEEGF